jgi:hypothetical protein
VYLDYLRRLLQPGENLHFAHTKATLAGPAVAPKAAAKCSRPPAHAHSWGKAGFLSPFFISTSPTVTLATSSRTPAPSSLPPSARRRRPGTGAPLLPSSPDLHPPRAHRRRTSAAALDSARAGQRLDPEEQGWGSLDPRGSQGRSTGSGARATSLRAGGAPCEPSSSRSPSPGEAAARRIQWRCADLRSRTPSSRSSRSRRRGSGGGGGAGRRLWRAEEEAKRQAATGANAAARLASVPPTGGAGAQVEGEAALLRCPAARPCSNDRSRDSGGSARKERGDGALLRHPAPSTLPLWILPLPRGSELPERCARRMHTLLECSSFCNTIPLSLLAA